MLIQIVFIEEVEIKVACGICIQRGRIRTSRRAQHRSPISSVH